MARKFKIAILIAGLAAQVIAATETKPEELKYTEADFIKKVSEELSKKVVEIKNKSVTDLTRELIKKEEGLKLRELEIIKKEDQLKVNGIELEKRAKEFNQGQQTILGCLDKNEDEMKNRVANQVEIIGSMKPEKAAEILTVQEAEIAVRILQQLSPLKASKIFNFMDKETSARLQKQYLNMKR